MFGNYEIFKKSSVIKDIGHLKDERADTSIHSNFSLIVQFL